MDNSIDLRIILRAFDETKGAFSSMYAGIRKAETRFATFSQNAQKWGRKTYTSGRDMSMGLTLPLAVIGGSAIKVGMDFSKSLSRTNTMLKISQARLKEFGDGIIAISNKTGVSSADLALAAYRVTSVLHTNANQTLDVMKGIGQAAKAGGITAVDASGAVIKALNDYGFKAKDTMKIVDQLSATVNAGDASWQDLAQNLPNVLGASKAIGASFSDVNALFATLSGKAGNAAEATTQYQGMINAFMGGSPALQKAFKTMGYGSGQAAIKALGMVNVLKKLSIQAKGSTNVIKGFFPNIRATSGFLSLFSDKGIALAKSQKIVKDSIGETQKQIDASENSYEKIKVSLNELRNAGISLFKTLSPFLVAFTNKIRDLAHWFMGLSHNTKKWILIIGGALMVIGPMLIILGSLVIAVSRVALAFSFAAKVITGTGKAISMLMGVNPVILAIVAAVALLAFAAYEIIKHWKPIKKFFIGLWNGIKNVFSEVVNFIYNLFLNWTIYGLIIKHWQGINKFFTEILTSIGNAFVVAFNAIKDFMSSLFAYIKATIVGDWNGIYKFFKTIFNSIIKFAQNRWNEFKKITVMVWNAIKKFFVKIWNEITGIFSGAYTKIMNFVNPILNAINKVKSAVSSVTSSISGGISSGVSDVGNWIKGATGLATGGIVTRPTLAMIGEGGSPEAVIPLNKMNGMGNIVVNINGGNYLSEDAAEDIGDKIIEKLKLQIKL